MKTLTNYRFTVQIEAETQEQAKELVNSALSMIEVVRENASTDDFCLLAKKVTEKPSLIKKAMLFI